MSDPKRSWMAMDEFHREGLLYRANRDFFWPLGLALAVSVGTEPKPGEERPDDAGPEWGKPGEYAPFLLLLRLDDPPDRIEDPDPELDARSQAWIDDRLAAIPAANGESL